MNSFIHQLINLFVGSPLPIARMHASAVPPLIKRSRREGIENPMNHTVLTCCLVFQTSPLACRVLSTAVVRKGAPGVPRPSGSLGAPKEKGERPRSEVQLQNHPFLRGGEESGRAEMSMSFHKGEATKLIAVVIITIRRVGGYS